MTDQITIDAAAQARAEMRGFEITGEIFGQEHAFCYLGREAFVRVPAVTLDVDMNPVDADYVALRSSVPSDLRPATTTYEIDWVEVSVSLPDPLTLPEAMLRLPPKQICIAGDLLTADLDRLSLEGEQHLAETVRHWSDVVRWISGMSLMGAGSGRSGRAASQNLERTALVNRVDGHVFWRPVSLAAAFGSGHISLPVWDQIAAVLRTGQQAPLWFRFIDDARRRLFDYDFSGALLSSAIASETIAREVMWICAGSTETEAARDIIDRVPISSITGKWEKLTGMPKAESHIDEIKHIFTLRNRQMHKGGSPADLQEDEIERLVEAARRFVLTADVWYYEQIGVTNPRTENPAVGWRDGGRKDRLQSPSLQLRG